MRLLGERRLREQRDKSLIGFIRAGSHDHFMGHLDQLAPEFTAPFIDGALCGSLLGSCCALTGKEPEFVGQRGTVPGGLTPIGRLVDRNAHALESIFDRKPRLLDRQQQREV